MIFRTASLLVCTLLLVYLADSSARCEDNSKKSEAPKKYSLEFMGEAQVIIPKLRYDGSHPITLEARVKPYSRDDDFVRSSVVANLVTVHGLGSSEGQVSLAKCASTASVT